MGLCVNFVCLLYCELILLLYALLFLQKLFHSSTILLVVQESCQIALTVPVLKLLVVLLPVVITLLKNKYSILLTSRKWMGK